MVDTAITVVLKRLAPVIEKGVKDEVCLVLNSSKEAETLFSKLKRIQQVLDDAEWRSVKEAKVEDWLERLKEVAYEMDDALDEWEMKSHQSEMEEPDQDFWGKVSSFIQSLCLCFKDVLERRNIAWKIKELNGSLESIAKQNEEEFKFLPKISKDPQGFVRVRETSDIEVTKVHGREAVKKSLVNKLLSYNGSQEMEIVSVVGVGGLGKTTLAKLAYNDTELKGHFQTKIWICVSDPFDEIRIAKAIVESVEGSSPNLTEFESLLRRVETCISGKRFLLVLDDVWSEDEKKWTPLKSSLSNGVPGSKILVTTRKRTVVEMMGATQFEPLRPLSESDCWSLLSQIAFRGRGKEDPNRQEKIGKEIAKRCKGLPLAAVTLGSLLRKKVTVQEWEKVLKSEIWELEKENVGVELFPHLYLSYNELSPPLKRCFSYCAIFPKGSAINADRLINMWMAQGFLSSGNGSGSADDMELKGREYFEDLVASSLFTERVQCRGKIESCKIHDIVHDFAQSLTKNECFIVDERVRNTISASLVKARHINWLGTPDLLTFNAEKLRSFLCKGNPPPCVLGSLKCVRLLSIDECDFEELPLDIGNLIHLRHLKLRDRNVRRLPRSLCDLYYLHTLDVSICFSLKVLPEEMYKLKNLRHLLVSLLVILPRGVGELTDLRTLSKFKAKRGGSKLGYLKNINQLEGGLLIKVTDLNEESDGIEAQNAQLEKKTRLQFLYLIFEGETRMDVIEALRPPPNLLLLSVKGLGQYPQWMGSLNNLKILSITECSSVPSLLWNLQSLEELQIRSRSMERLRSNEFLGITDLIGQKMQIEGGSTTTVIAFPRLKRLLFGNLRGWEDITEDEENVASITIMPCLQELKVQLCPKLKSLPCRLLRKIPQLEYLNISKSNLLIKQYKLGKGFEFLSPMCRVELDRWGEPLLQGHLL